MNMMAADNEGQEQKILDSSAGIAGAASWTAAYIH